MCAQNEDCYGWLWREEGAQCHLKVEGVIQPCSGNGCTSPCGLVVRPPKPPPPHPKGAKNVVFIVSDDFRPSLSMLGAKEVLTPHLEKLAQSGIIFSAAHVQFSYCAPSRNSFMSGRRPDATKVYNFNNHFRESNVGENWTALPEHFKNNGYLVTGSGKLFHPGVPPNFDQPRSWSSQGPSGVAWPYMDQPPGVNASRKCNTTGLSFVDRHFCLTTPQNNTFLLDEAVANQVLDRLGDAINNYKKTSQPFFVGMGTHRPHLPWVYPRQYFDNVQENVKEATHKYWPADVPHLGFHECAEMSSEYIDTNGLGTPFSNHSFNGHQSLMRRAYYGCLGYADNLIGQVLTMLDDRGVTNSTVVSFIGDHGWHLGEHDMWCKMSTLELGTRIPMIIRAPWISSAVGVKTTALAEAVDLYPTLSELAGLTLPTGQGGEYLGGQSLVPVMQDPQHATAKNETLSQFPRCWQNNTHHTSRKPGDENNRTSSWESMSDCHWTDRSYIDFMGYKMRTPNASITIWYVWDGQKLSPKWQEVVGIELYDHAGDDGMAPAAFDDYENVNLAGNPEWSVVQKQLRARLEMLIKRYMTPW